MRAAYKYLAYAMGICVLVQAAAIAWAVFGLWHWVDGGGRLTKSVMDSGESHFDEELGFMIHGFMGMPVIPVVGLVLLVVAFFAKVSGGVKWAGMLFGGVVIQVASGYISFGAPFVGLLHGVNALLLFWLAFRAAKAADEVAVADSTVPGAAATS